MTNRVVPRDRPGRGRSRGPDARGQRLCAAVGAGIGALLGRSSRCARRLLIGFLVGIALSLSASATSEPPLPVLGYVDVVLVVVAAPIMLLIGVPG